MYVSSVVILLCAIISVNCAVTPPRTEVLDNIFLQSRTANITADFTENQKNSKNGTNVCMSKGCVKTAAQILDLIDENIDPCDNFYDFACGKFLHNTIIPDDKIAVMSFVQVQDKVQDQMRLIINEKSQSNESKPFTLAKVFNEACLDLVTLETRGSMFKYK